MVALIKPPTEDASGRPMRQSPLCSGLALLLMQPEMALNHSGESLLSLGSVNILKSSTPESPSYLFLNLERHKARMRCDKLEA